MTDAHSSPKPRRAALAFIFVTVALDTLALGMIIPVLPKLVERFVGGDTARAVGIYAVFGTVWAVMQFFFAPVLGALSDRFGRRPVILLSNFGLGLDYVLMALAPTLSWLFVGRVLSGIASASIATAHAYIADVTPPERRARSYGLLGAAFGIGFVLGPAFGGVLGAIAPRLPFWVAAGFSLANAAYGLLVLPESLSPERRSAFSWRRANPLGSLTLLRSHPELSGLAAANFLVNLAHVVFPTVFVLFAGYRFGWDESAVGLSMAMFGLASIIVQAGLIGPVVAWLGERRAVLVGLSFGTAGMVMFGLATSAITFCLAILVTALWGFAGAAMQGLMTRRVSAAEQGRLQGANSSIVGVANLVGPSIFSVTFAYAINPSRSVELPGAPFLLAAVMLLGSALVAWRATRTQ